MMISNHPLPAGSAGIRQFLYLMMIVLLTACGPSAPLQPQVAVSDTSQEAAAAQPSEATHSTDAPHSENAAGSVPLTGKGMKVQVAITDQTFSQPEVFIPAGATVVWTNQGQDTHTVIADENAFQSGSLKGGDTFEFTFDRPGTYIYHLDKAGGGKIAGSVTVFAAAAQSMNMDMPAANLAGSDGQPADQSPTQSAAANSQQPAANGVKREYYIAAVEVEWDFAPANMNQITGKPFGDTENVFVEHGDTRIGKVYTKAVYREFTDETFTTQKSLPTEWKHLGVMGPVMHAEVGDQIIVHYKNMATIPTSMHPHGVFYNKDSEGSGYNDGTSGDAKGDDSVPPGGTHTYVWNVPDRAGPGPMDPSSVMWMYHSHVDEPGDTNAGLIGAIIVTAHGKAKADGSPKDVDREFVLTFTVMDENISPYLEHNIKTKTGTPDKVDQGEEEFGESNLMHSINGYVYGNLPGLTMKKGERVRWYVMGMGTEVDLHTPHWHGNVVTWNGMRTDVITLMPASMSVVDMVPDNPGTWLLHCHINDHIIAGMQATYTVEP